MLRVSEHFERSDTGRQRRANEDAVFARAPLFAVADGMGGARAGEVAARVAVETLERGLPESGSLEDRLATRAREANTRIHDLSRGDDQLAGMGTTFTATYVGDGEVSIAHVGDSRAYRLRDGELTRLTRDHSMVEELVRQGKMTEAQAESHPQRSVITRALGPEARVEVDTRTCPARDGDVFLLCSDGLTSMVSEARVGAILAEAPTLEQAGRRLVDEANAAGGRDNVTVVLFRLEDVADAGVEQPTNAGDDAPSVDEVRAAVAQRGGESDEAEQQAAAASTAIPRRTAPLPRSEPEPARKRRRRWRPRVPTAVALLVAIGVIAAGAWIATRAVYFVGTDSHGFVAVYRGLPYDLPAGVHLYERYYTSAVPASDLAAARRKSLLDHRLRSRSDASDLVRRIELGKLAG